LSFLLFLLAFVSTDFALIILIFAMLLSPEITAGGITGRAVVLRLDDIILFVIFLGWLAKMAVNKELGLLKTTLVNRPIFAYIFVCLLSTAIGGLARTTNPKESVFYILKYLEYFIVFFMVSNNIRDKRQIKIFVFFMLLTCLIVSSYAIFVYYARGMRASAPFEGASGEPNTLAGYLLVIMGMTLGLFLELSSKRGLRFLLGIFLVFIMLTFLFTLSRGGWLGFIAMFLSLLIFTRKQKMFLLISLLFVILGSSFIFPKEVVRRFESTFRPGTTYTILGTKITLDESSSERIKSWQHSFDRWLKRPILGYGVPGDSVVSDVQYARILREVGLVGLLAFFWLITRLFKVGMRSFTSPQIDDFGKGLSLGFISSLVGLLVMGLASEVFIIIRIMEPFWFLAAIVAMLPEIINNTDVQNDG
jgi:O-antigen ligase